MNNLSLTTRLLYKMENNTAIGMFLRDTGGCLVSKLAVARSFDESREITFAELAESALFYFSTTLIALPASKVFSKLYKIKPNQLLNPLADSQEIVSKTSKNVKLAKFGQIAATFSILLPLIFGIAPFRNILTLFKTGKDEFTSVVNLKDKSDPDSKKVRKRVSGLTEKLALSAIAGLSASAGLLLLARKPGMYKKMEPLVNKIIKHLDFEDGKNLSLKQLGFLIMPVSIASYLIASRDRYEVLENLRRFTITIPMMFFGQNIIERSIYKFQDRINGSSLASTKGIMKYDDIFKLNLPEQAKNIKSKNSSIAIAFVTNTMAIAAAIGLLNRISTKRKFIREEVNMPKRLNQNPMKNWQLESCFKNFLLKKSEHIAF